MKRLLFLAVLFSFEASGQSDSLKWVKEINEQVWKPFITHFTSNNREGFKSLHSKRITRVEVDRNLVRDFDKYFPPLDSAALALRAKKKRSFDLRFDKRISNGDKAWETGFFKGTVQEEGKQALTYYGRFFIVLEKENGVWKILVDADTGIGATEENFKNAFSMEEKE